MRTVERIAKGRDPRPNPIFNQPFGFSGFNVRLHGHLGRVMRDTVAADFMPVLNQLFQHGDVIFTPINFPPIISMPEPTVMGRVLVGDQEKCGWNAVEVENGERLLKLAPKPVIEGKRNQRWVVHRPASDCSMQSCQRAHRTLLEAIEKFIVPDKLCSPVARLLCPWVNVVEKLILGYATPAFLQW
jgi:hypothetical protein